MVYYYVTSWSQLAYKQAYVINLRRCCMKASCICCISSNYHCNISKLILVYIYREYIIPILAFHYSVVILHTERFNYNFETRARLCNVLNTQRHLLVFHLFKSCFNPPLSKSRFPWNQSNSNIMLKTKDNSYHHETGKIIVFHPTCHAYMPKDYALLHYKKNRLTSSFLLLVLSHL